MILYRKLVVSLLAFGIFPLVAASQVAPEKVSSKMLKESIKAVTGIGANSATWQTVALNQNLKSSIKGELKIKRNLPDSMHVGHIENGKSQFYIIPDIAPSKSEMFSYVLYLDSAEKIVDVDVLEYRESYGYEIDYSFFREQFKGIEVAENIRFNRSIQNISGATISARNITRSVHDLMLIINRVELN